MFSYERIGSVLEDIENIQEDEEFHEAATKEGVSEYKYGQIVEALEEGEMDRAGEICVEEFSVNSIFGGYEPVDRLGGYLLASRLVDKTATLKTSKELNQSVLNYF